MRHKAHDFFLLAALILLITQGVVQAQEPQFKMWIAFEDDSAQKDTVWVVIDESASLNGLDTAFGEDSVQLDSAGFQVYFGINYFTKIFAAPPSNMDSGSYNATIQGKNANVPIKMSWDTNAIRNNELQYEIRRLRLLSNGIFAMGYSDGFSAFQTSNNSLEHTLNLKPFYIAGGQGNHFPIRMIISNEEIDVGFFNQKNVYKQRVSPNPATGRINFNRVSNGVRVYDLSGNMLMMIESNDIVDMDVSGLAPGVYILQITDQNGSYNQRLIKQ